MKIKNLIIICGAVFILNAGCAFAIPGATAILNHVYDISREKPQAIQVIYEICSPTTGCTVFPQKIISPEALLSIPLQDNKHVVQIVSASTFINGKIVKQHWNNQCWAGNNKPAVIAAGYYDKKRPFLACNPGIK